MTHFGKKKRSFANTLSSIFHCPPSILLKLSTIFLGDLTWRRWWFDPSVTFLYEKTCRCCCCPYGSSPISSSTISFTRWLKYIMTFCLENDFFFSIPEILMAFEYGLNHVKRLIRKSKLIWINQKAFSKICSSGIDMNIIYLTAFSKICILPNVTKKIISRN